jgi:thiol-disulfide isomerase/thioredoxin
MCDSDLCKTRTDFLRVKTERNPGALVFWFTATWCGPCKTVAPVLAKYANMFARTTPHIRIIRVDVDECMDTYSFMRSRRMVDGVPTLLCYGAENGGIAPDCAVSGGNINNVHAFFDRVQAIARPAK